MSLLPIAAATLAFAAPNPSDFTTRIDNTASSTA
jgi:hypothetical protein